MKNRQDLTGIPQTIMKLIAVAIAANMIAAPVFAQKIEELVVRGRAALEGSTASVLSVQREATTVTEVSGAEEFLRLGDSNAAETLERVTGLTVEDGKFVVIR